ncbi:DUF3558 family protein [Promicromonospora iranensis]|uniref:DUF3558 family protein n=1 Tax=Promicromonospora iranensis TaxID=1105144 RepID=A0ABU2CM27_9MICO|nr:DUF3558 family protein [Promicromonospora iranensis]MDR7382407.1 hypothetical protein [Promicromonospora iranensis]
MRLRPVRNVLFVIAVSLLAACSAVPATPSEPSASPDDVAARSSSPSPATKAPGPCSLVDAEVIAELAGSPLEAKQAVKVGGQLPACQWGTNDLGVQVAQVPAGEWAQTLPSLINQMRLSGELGADNQRKLNEAAEMLASDDLGTSTACEVFSLMTELSMNEPDMTSIINYAPNQDDPQAVTAQACIDGVYSSIMLVSTDLTADVATTTAAETALAALVFGDGS